MNLVIFGRRQYGEKECYRRYEAVKKARLVKYWNFVYSLKIRDSKRLHGEPEPSKLF